MPFSIPIPVRFRDVDMIGHVNNAVYLTYFEQARIEFFQKVLGDVDWNKNGFILARAEVNFMLPLVLHDKAETEVWCSRIGNKSFDFSYKVFKITGEEKTEMANGLTVMVAFDYRNNQPIPIPEDWKEKLQGN
ncbi:MAG: esterase [Flavobacteriales bacterium]|nr:MAG: esterase [Flavobacteriales bacterium]